MNDDAERCFRQAQTVFDGIRDSFGAKMSEDLFEGVLSEVAGLKSERESCGIELLEVRRLLDQSQEMKNVIHL